MIHPKLCCWGESKFMETVAYHGTLKVHHIGSQSTCRELSFKLDKSNRPNFKASDCFFSEMPTLHFRKVLNSYDIEETIITRVITSNVFSEVVDMKTDVS